jgi:small subunit ribosomal protein S20
LANIKSQEKRNKQNEKRRVKNVQVKSSVRTSSKKLVKALEAKETAKPETINELFKSFTKTIDTASGKGVVHKNTASRKKSRLAKKVNAFVKQNG